MNADDSVETKRTPPAPLPDAARGQAPGRGRLDGRRILIVGGGQQDHGLEDPPIGNGRAMSVLFAREGASVAIADIDRASAEASAELARQDGGSATVVVADAADEASVAEMFATAQTDLGGLDGVVLNVGTAGGFMLRGTSVEDWDHVMAVNLRSQFLGVRNALAAMAEGGSVVMIGSIAAREVLPIPAYGASKAALESLCRQTAVEGAPRVRCNLLEPGLIDTSLGRWASKLSPRREQVRIPAGRQGSAWEVAHAALFLISDEASYVTGQCLIVDGGLTTAPRA
jgi:NAD(P)-dependent dehydrogenase (short-subunit alcohol dehydrogenase family)